jgi:SAM-dependent methyltransferase
MSHPAPSPAPVSREFYEEVAGRNIDRNTARGIEYRNVTIARRLGGPGRVLEIGPGEGWLVRRLLASGNTVVTTDLSRRWLSRLPSAGDPKLLRAQGDALSLPFPGESFDRVVAAEVLEHLPDPGATLREVRRVLKPGGKFVATVPYRETLRQLFCPHCGQSFEPNGHLHRFDEESFRALFRGAGLEPGHLFVGPTRFSREIWRRAPWMGLIPMLHAMDRGMLSSQRVSDTWMLLEGTRVRGA